MPAWKYPGFKWVARSVKAKRDKVFVLRRNANARLCLLAQYVAKDAAFFVGEILLCAFQFFHHLLGQNWQRNELRVRMVQ